MPTETAQIEKLVYEGWGLARLKSGQVAFFENVAKGEIVEFESQPSDIRNKKPAFIKNFKIIQPNANRLEPICKDFAHCGGCNWQFLPYADQLKAKQAILVETLQRNKVEYAPNTLNDIVASPNETAYRSSIKLKACYNDQDQCQLGYSETTDHGFCHFKHCHLVSDGLNQFIKSLEKLVSDHLQACKLETCSIRVNDHDNWLVSLKLQGTLKAAIKEKLVQFIQGFSELHSLVVESTEGETIISNQKNSYQIKVANEFFLLNHRTFFQINLPILESVGQFIKQYVQTGHETLLDLYGGVGLFSKILGKDIKQKVILVEENTDSATFAMQNLAPFMANKKVQIYNNKVEEYLINHKQPADLVILDPPRKGCSSKVLNWCSQGGVNKQLVYISCNPTTLARDLNRLQAEGAWEIKALQAFDFFPQTYHFETIAILEPL